MAITKKTTVKSTVKKPVEKKSAVKKTTKSSIENNIKINTAPTKPFEPIDLSKDFNESPLFDTFIYRELFMSLRKNLDDLAAKRGKSEKDYSAYDDAVYNLIANATTDVAAQDFMGYCYKKGVYDFCILNYEKFMKWTLLAGANGNPFSISKLQIFFASSLNDILLIDGQAMLLDFLEITDENYYVLLQKMLCEEMVKILNITSENLIKLPEAYQEQNEDLTKLFNKTKMEATEKVKEFINNSLKELNERVNIEYEKMRKQQERETAEKLKKEELKTTQEEKEKQPLEEIKEPVKETKKVVKKAPSKQKFRW